MHSLQRDTQRQRAVDELRSSLRIAAEQIGRGEQDDCDQAFDEIEVELFGKKMADP